MGRGTERTKRLLILCVGLAGSGCVSGNPLTSLPLGRSETAALPQIAALAQLDAPSLAPPASSGPTPSLTPASATLEATAPAAPPTNSDPLPRLRELYRAADERYRSIDSYIVRLRRREQNHSKDGPEELLLFKFRKEPFSVHLKWLGLEGKGREVLYVRNQYGDKLHTLLAAGDMPFAPAGKRLDLPRDSVLVRSASRHDISDAGVGVIIDGLGAAIARLEHEPGRPGGVRVLGVQQRPEFAGSLDAIEYEIPATTEATLPRGGRRQVFFDPATALPVLVCTQDETGREVEYYCYDRFEYPVKLGDDDFNPEIVWKTQ